MDDDSGLASDRSVSRADYFAAIGLSVLLVGTAILITPQASKPAVVIPGFMPVFGGAMIVIDVVLAVLLFSKGAIARRAAPIRLGTAYLFAALIIIPHLAALPGAIMPLSLIGSSASAVWLWTFWHTGFALAIIRHVLSVNKTVRPGAIITAVLATAGLVGLLTVVATWGLPYLPPVLVGNTYFDSPLTAGVPLVVVLTNVVALVLVATRLRLRSAEDLWLTVAMLAALIDVWLTYCAGGRFTLGWYVSRAASLVTCMVVLVWLFRDITVLYSKVAKANQLLQELASLDGLTGLANRRHMDDVFAREWRRAQRDGLPLSFVLMDVDHFKRFNDRYGHLDGDQCLRRVGECLQAVARRPGDLAARYGGEEFALVLPATDLAGATQLANEVRLMMRAQGIPHDDSGHGIVTISVGVATMQPRPGQDASAMIAAADGALYAAKKAGRDQVHVTPSAEVVDEGVKKLGGADGKIATRRANAGLKTMDEVDAGAGRGRD
jgi:diguanylate cyclase (GGDEF)-like protein